MQSAIDRFIDAVVEIGYRLLSKGVPLALAGIATAVTIHAVVTQKVSIEGAIVSLTAVYAAVGAFATGKLNLDTQASRIAADRRMDSNSPGIPIPVVQTVKAIEAQKVETQRETGDNSLPKDKV